MTKYTYNENLVFYAICSICLFGYTSLAASSAYHVLIAVPAFYYLFKGKNLISLPLSAKAILATMFFCTLSIFLNPDVPEKFHKFGDLRYMLIGVLTIYAFNAVWVRRIKDKQISIFLWLILISSGLASVSGIIGLFTGFNPLRFKAASEEFRATGMYGMAITYGYGIQMIVLLSAGLLYFRKQIEKYIPLNLVIFTLVSSGLGLYFSYTRGALVGLLVGLPFIFFRTQKKLFWKLLVAGAGLLVVAVGIMFAGGLSNRFLLDAKNDSNNIRIAQYQTAYYAFLEKPWIGHGYRNFAEVSDRIKKEHNIEFQDFISHAHNNLVEFLVDSGIFAFLGLLIFQLSWAWECWKRQDYIGDISLAIIIAFFISGFFQCTIIDAENVFVLYFMYGVTQVTSARIKKFSTEKNLF